MESMPKITAIATYPVHTIFLNMPARGRQLLIGNGHMLVRFPSLCCSQERLKEDELLLYICDVPETQHMLDVRHGVLLKKPCVRYVLPGEDIVSSKMAGERSVGDNEGD